MATLGHITVPYVHHSDGYNKISLFQQNVLKHVTPHVAAATRSVRKNRDDTSFMVVDYGAADGLNSVPMIAECAGELLSEVSEFKWMFNDLSSADNIHMVEDQLNKLSGWIRGSVKLQYVVGSFYHQVVPDASVDLGVSVSAVHWLSHRPPTGCSTNPWHPDEATKAICAKDWVDFLQCRAKELKQRGRLITAIFTTGNNSPMVMAEKEDILDARLQVINDMYLEGIITKEEYEFVCVFPMSYRTEADLQSPFQDTELDLSEILHLVDIKTYEVPCPFYHKWMKAGGRENASATEEFVSEHVNFTKSFYNSLWRILEVTRSREVHYNIVETFYKRVEEMVRANMEGYYNNKYVTVVDIIKC